jgi:ketosteroid isomerase-like protein
VKSLRVTIEGLKIDMFGVAAVATLLVHYRAETSQGDVVATLRSTIVLVRDSASWKIAHEHFSPLVTKR